MKTTSFSTAATTTALALLLTGLVVIGGTAGCGSGKSSTGASQAASSVSRGTGRAVFTLTWPKAAPASRLIPQAANSIGVEVLFGGQVIARKVTARDPNQPTQQVAFDNLPIDTVTIRATAYPTTDGTGVAQATGTQDLAISEGEPAQISLTMGTTIVRMALTPTNPTVEAGKTTQLTVTSYDAQNAVVLSAPVWTSSDDSIATVTQAGLVTTTAADPKSAPRTVTITATDAESGTSASAPLTVTVPHLNAGPAQFNPLASGNGTLIPGDLDLSSASSYTITSDTARITDFAGKTIAQGEVVTKLVGVDQTPVKYAIFNVAGNIRMSGSSTIYGWGTYPIVLLARGSFTLDSKARLNFSAVVGLSSIAGAGGGTAGKGPGAGLTDGTIYGGGSFGGLGGGSTKGVYGSDFDDQVSPYLQGGSGGSYVGAAGGAIYVAAVGPLTINDATVSATGGASLFRSNSGSLIRPTITVYGSGGSGGGIALWSGTSVTFTKATISAIGASGRGTVGTYTYQGGGGGRVLIGYPAGAPAPDTSAINVSGGSNGGNPGVISTRTFDGF